MAIYTIKAVETVKPTAENKGTIGIRLHYNGSNGKLSAIVGSTWVGLYETSDGKASFKAQDFGKWDTESEAKKARDLASAQRYLMAKYCITQKAYAFLVDLAKSGKCLLTKAEAKALTAKAAC